MKKDYLPNGDTQFLAWYDNLVNKIPTYATELGITNDEVTNLQNSLQETKAKLGEHTAMKTSLQSLTQAKKNTVTNARSLARTIGSRDALLCVVYSTPLMMRRGGCSYGSFRQKILPTHSEHSGTIVNALVFPARSIRITAPCSMRKTL